MHGRKIVPVLHHFLLRGNCRQKKVQNLHEGKVMEGIGENMEGVVEG